VSLFVVPVNELDNNVLGGGAFSLRQKRSTDRVQFQRYDEREIDNRVVRSTVCIDGWEIAWFKFLCNRRLRVNLERLVKRVKPTQASGEGVQDMRITIDGFVVEDSIMTEPDVVGKTLNDDFIRPDGA
jgi:hypothetical protein